MKKTSHNSWSLAGSVSEEPKTYRFDNGGGMVNVTLQVVLRRYDRTKRVWENALAYLPVSYFCEDPDLEAKSLRIGSYVIADGHFEPWTYETRNGKRTVLDPKADNIDIVQIPSSVQPIVNAEDKIGTAEPKAPETLEQFNDDDIPF